jgi:hypothetical protein
MAMPAPVLPAFRVEPHLRLVKAAMHAEERAATTMRSRAFLVVAAVLVGAAIAVVVIAQGGRETDPGQAWFWTPEWQAGEAEADAEIAAGQTTRHDSDEAFEQALLARMKPE